MGFPFNDSVAKNLHYNVGDMGSIPGPRNIPWRRKWQLTPVFLTEKSPWIEETSWLQAMESKSWTWL